MSPALILLDEVRWQGVRVIGDRAHTLLAVLALHGRTGVGDERLIEELWPDEVPANPTKALRVVVSRTRAATRADVVVRIARGYRLGLPADQVDALLLGTLVEQARAALGADDVALARRRAEEALGLVADGVNGATGPLAVGSTTGPLAVDGTAGPLAELRGVAAG